MLTPPNDESEEWIRRFDTLTTRERPTTNDSYLLVSQEHDDAFRTDYQEWIRRFDNVTETDRKAIQDYLDTLDLANSPEDPNISLIMVVTDPDPARLRDAIGSLLGQIWHGWQLIVVNNGSTDPEVQRTLDDYRTSDSRMRIIDLDTREVYSDALNRGLAQADGTYVGTFGQEDQLRPHTLAWMSIELHHHPKTVVLYSDHDRIDESGSRYDHHFKPDWSPELIRCQDYIGKSVLFATHHVIHLDGFSPSLTNFPEWDMTLRLALAHPGDNFRHIPSVLYHQRRSDGHESQPTGTEASTIVTAYLENLGIPFELKPAVNGRNLIPTFAIQGSPKVSIIIPTRNALEDLQACLTSLKTTSYDNYEVIVVNNASDDPQAIDYLQQLTTLPRYRVIDYPYPFDYAALHNTVIADLDTDYLCLLNNDTEILTPDWLTNMLGYAQLPGVGAVGAKLLYPDDTVQHGGVIIGIGGIAAHAHLNLKADEEGYHQRAILPQNLSAVTAACVLMRSEHYRLLDGMDPELPIAFNDVDLCLRLREAGLRNIYQPLAILRHHESKSRGKDTLASHQERALGEHTHMRWSWGTDLLTDPYYNLNLALDDESGYSLGPSRVIPPWSRGVNWYTLPDCHNFGHSQPLPLFNGDSLEAHCRLPQRIDGTISLIQVMIGAPSGMLDGSIHLTAELGNQKATSTESLNGHRGEFPFTFRLDPKQKLKATPGALLSFHLTLKDATEPLYLILYTTADGWGHQIAGLRNKALRVTLALEV